MAHELAHAIINTHETDYKGEEGGGHGEKFYKVMKEIKEIIRSTPNYEVFEAW